MTTKKYPFSMTKNGHNVELAYNHQKLICGEMEDGVRGYDTKAFKYLNELTDAYLTALGHEIAWVDGKTYRTLKMASQWAECYRDRRNHR